ncbi:DUF4126 family protein [Sphingomonas jatrophae]|uniref:Uncharacterized membrane protein n=1 Tax=Sphingomonas jatrophae TaxID=1166337 RepID=A0A1I6LJ84_9SPHN|nr:DUF4126 family protein [Sphingomonas jatrophae]SFS03496.1 Uncharacterized membrane protein [Sphingomonas jatrophae]
MIRSILIGLAAGQRAMSPLPVIAGAFRRKKAEASGPFALMAHPLVAAGAVALSAAEMAGDKMKTAPDRIVPVGLVARAATGAFAGAALADEGRWRTGALLGAAASVASSYVGFALRVRAMRRYGQTATGFVEDALVLGGAWAAATAQRTA